MLYFTLVVWFVCLAWHHHIARVGYKKRKADGGWVENHLQRRALHGADGTLVYNTYSLKETRQVEHENANGC